MNRLRPSRRFSSAGKFDPLAGVARNDPAGYFGIFNNYAAELKTKNFGQGFPDFPPPDFVQKALRAVSTDPREAMHHQYARASGLPSLAAEVAQDFSQLLGRKLDPLKEILVCNGAAGAFMCFVQSFLRPGDEVVTFEPTYVYYLNIFDIIGVKVTFVPLFERDGRMVFDEQVLAAAFSSKTRMFMVNSPHNPSSKVYSREELETIAKVLRKHPDTIVVSDEVYYNLTYESRGKQSVHTFFASLPDMYDRTVSI